MINTIFDEIKRVAVKENQLIESLKENDGVFLMPELAFVYEFAKQLDLNSKVLFPGKSFSWTREQKVSENSGQTDLLLEIGGERIYMEFKMDTNANSWVKDIVKLQVIKRHDKDCRAFFCCIKAFFDDMYFQNACADKINEFGEFNDKKAIVNFKHFTFPVKYSAYKKDSICFIGMWEVM